MQKNFLGKAGRGALIGTIIGAVIAVAVLAGVAPTIFADLVTLNGTTGLPTWAGTVAMIVAGAGIVMMIWRLWLK